MSSGCCLKLKEKKPDRILYIFDFDRTIVSNNSEYIYKEFLTTESTLGLLSNEILLSDWTLMCRAILDQLKQQNVEVSDILNRVRLLTFVPGMDTLLQKIFQSTLENGEDHLVILSGSNDLFISTLLSSLQPPVYPNLIISNHLFFSEEKNYLDFNPLQFQENCPFCTPSLCKGDNMQKYLKQNGPFSIVYYTGDGGNDVCAAIRLRTVDVLFVREGFSLESAIRSGFFNDQKISIKAKVIYFNNPKIIEKYMKIR